MKRTRIFPNLANFPTEFHRLLSTAPVYDSSCSKEARVWYIEREGGLYLKTNAPGTLNTEADMTRYFHAKGLGPEVLDYRSGELDWLLTRALPGEDCTHPQYMENPKRLCDTLAVLLRQLHETDFAGCPVTDRCGTYCTNAARNYRDGYCELDLFPLELWGFPSVEDAWKTVQKNAHLLKNEVLIHGDYCFPNILLDNWRFSGFIDLGSGGIGDRHFDVFWGVWTLFFNLKTNIYYDRFLDAYGREKIEPELLQTVAALEMFT